MRKKPLIITALIVLVLIGLFFAGLAFGIFQRPYQPNQDDDCYNIDLQILDCSYAQDTRTATLDLKLKSGNINGIQGIISGQISGESVASLNTKTLNWNSPTQETVELNFYNTFDGKTLDNFEGPYEIQIRPTMNGQNCIQFDTEACTPI